MSVPGAIIAAALTMPKPYSLPEIVALYQELAERIFTRNWYAVRPVSRYAFGALYDIKRLYEVLKGHFGEIRVGDCPKLVTTVYSTHERRYNTNCATVIFPNVHKPHGPKHYAELHDLYLADVVTGSCAAPAYFHPHDFHHTDRETGATQRRRFRDGGVMDNSGILGAVAALCTQEEANRTDVKDLSILALGNGGVIFMKIPHRSHCTGSLYWSTVSSREANK
ncbi:MAG: patatin-like phospholipase family protein [Zetaproteobacteria bacterium]|nr:patatin-like phospholipase family protein [Zetaproteobacteria bacterium]